MTNPSERERLQALAGYRILDTGSDPLLEMVVGLAAATFDVQYSTISLVGADRHWCKARVGDTPAELDLRLSICRDVVDDRGVLVLNDTLCDPRYRAHPAVTMDGGVRFYAGVPLTAASGHCLGTLCVFDTAPASPTPVQLERLGNLAEIAMGLIEAHRAGLTFCEQKDYLLRLADNSPGGLFEFTMDETGRKRLNFVSAGIRDTIGISPADAVHDIENVFRNIHSDDMTEFEESIDTAFRNRARWEKEFRVNHPSRGTLHVLGISSPTSEEDGVVTWQGCLMDVTEQAVERARLLATRKELEQRYGELAEYQKLFDQIGRMAKVGACSLDPATRQMQWTREVYAMHGVDESYEPTLDRMLGFCDPARVEEVSHQVMRMLERGEALDLEYPINAADGLRRWLRAIFEAERSGGALTRLVGSIQDITEERRLLERVSYHATHDYVTGLGNRPAFLKHLSGLLTSAATGTHHAVGFLDLDHFKDINDAFGYETGDRLILEIGRRLAAVAARHGGRSAAARFGGDEFAFVLADLDSIEGLPRRLRAIAEEIGAPTVIDGNTIHAPVSMGVSVSPKDGRTAALLLRKADLALRHSKQSGRARTSFFNRGMEAERSAEQLLKSEMAQGIANGEFEVFYQPIMEIKLGRLNGFEALLRWHHPSRGLVSAGVFAHLLDDAAIGAALSATVIEQVRDTILAWEAAGLPFGQVAINITSSQLRNPLFEEQLDALVGAGVAPRRLKLEITEGVLLGRTADRAFQILQRLRKKGFSISLDDFGTGYASLVHLTEFPIDQIKIDMSFVRQITTSDKARTIVHTMCALANGLNLTAVAEGIEDVHIEQMLRLMGCHYGQGYLYDKALPRQEAEAFIAKARMARRAVRKSG